MWIALGIALIVLWLIAKVVVGVASLAVHAALIAGVIAVIAHFARKSMGHRNRTHSALNGG